VRTTLAGRCAKRRTKPPITAWARRVVAEPAAYGATEHEATIVALLLAELEVSR
jgi:hypothetical protein